MTKKEWIAFAVIMAAASMYVSIIVKYPVQGSQDEKTNIYNDSGLTTTQIMQQVTQ